MNTKSALPVVDDGSPGIFSPVIKNGAERVAALRKAVQALIESNVAEKFGDPLEWQREVRKDRPLPGRD